MYGREYSSDVARRMMYGSRRTLQLLDEENESTIGPGEMLDKIKSATTELQKERQRFYDQRREYNKLVSADGRREYLEERIITAAEELGDTIGLLYGEKFEIPYNTDNEAILVLCDWHYGLDAKNIWNTYNKDVCKERVSYVVAKTIDKLLTHRCAKLHIVVLGDLIHGAIHTSARVASEELVCDQIMQVSEILAQSINELSKYVDQTQVYVTYGNHARTVQRKEDSIHRDNMERLVPWWLKERLKENENVTINTESENEFLLLNVCGHGVCATHGDIDSVKASTRLLPALFKKQYGCDIECIILADKHHRESFEELGVDSMICGALCGTDDYANNKRLYSTPSQLLLIVSRECGVEDECRIKCR